MAAYILRKKLGTTPTTRRKGASVQEKNKAALRELIEVAFNRRDLSTIANYLHADYHWHGPSGREARTPEGGAQVIAMYLQGFTELEVTVDEMIAENDRVVTRYTARGVQNGVLMGMPPTGKSFQICGILISRFKDGKVIEDWELFDLLHLFQQLGGFPPQA